jgi:hypothetical protein
MAVKRTTITAVAAAVLACAGVSACTITFGHPHQLQVSKDDLQKDISQRLATAGQPPQSVTCQNDLVGQLGQSVRCDVVMGPNSSFEPIATVTGLEGTKINYDVTPSVSKSQLETSVSQMITNSKKTTPDSVSCQSGLDGKVGAIAYCDVTTGGATTRRTVEVAAVSGLQMKYGLVPVLSKEVVESSLVFQLRQTGQNPDSATCAGDLQGKIGSTVECTINSAGQRQTYIVTVTAVQGENITYKFALRS